MFDKILIPTDGSEFTKVAINKGLELAKCTGGRVTALYVIDQTLFANIPVDSAITNVYAVLKKEGQAAVDYVRDLGSEMGVRVDVVVVDGPPARTIIDAAKEHDVVVMGTLGRTGISKLLMGSVAERVIRYSHVPVMVIRSPEVDKK